MTDYYAVLQVDARADPEVIEVAYRRLARKWHPDTNANPEAPARIRALNEAYEVLRDPAHRQAYDVERVAGTFGPAVAKSRSNPLLTAGVAVMALLVLARLGALLGRSALVLVVLGVGLSWWLRRFRS